MDIDELAEALGDEKFAELKTLIDDLTGQRDQARNESISKRKGQKERISTLEAENAALMERLGIDSADDIENLPDVAGMAEAGKQYEAKVKRLERLLGDTESALESERTLRKTSAQESEVTKAMAKHDFLAGDIVSSHIQSSLVWEGDELLFKSDDGHLVSVADGVAGIAKARPELLKSTGAGGAGVRSNNARGSEGQTTMQRADFEQLPPSKQMELAKEGIELH